MTPDEAYLNGYEAFKGMLFTPSSCQSLIALDDYLNRSDKSPQLQGLIQQCLQEPELLEFEFNRLCIGPNKIPAPPYESVFVSGRRQLMTDDTLAVIDAYQQVGLMANPDWAEPADFIGTELEFMSYLESLLCSPEPASLPADPAELRQLADRFLLEHLGQWYQEFTQLMAQNSRHVFWSEYALALRDFLQAQTQQAVIRQQEMMNEEAKHEIH